MLYSNEPGIRKSGALILSRNLANQLTDSLVRSIKRSSNEYSKFTLELIRENVYLFKMVKPGDVPGSKAIYYKLLASEGNTLKALKIHMIH